VGDILDQTMRALLRDLARSCAPVPLVEESHWQTVEHSEAAMLRSSDGSGMGIWVDARLNPPKRLAHLADQVQQWVIEELASSGAPTNWPRCPRHPHSHPMSAEVRDGTAVWICPEGGDPVPIGTL
jgi:hypothetical protein